MLIGAPIIPLITPFLCSFIGSIEIPFSRICGIA